MSESQVHYRPMIIKFCLALYAKSPGQKHCQHTIIYFCHICYFFHFTLRVLPIILAVGILEGTRGLKVVAATADGASSNRSFFKMHKGYSDEDGDVVYKTPNIFSDDELIFFF